MSPFFSICIPAYNAGTFISATIESVLSQSFEDFEVVILDNASTDQTSSLISRYSDSRIRIVTNTETVPAHENWTRTVGLARGTWVKLLCADDLLKPGALQKISDDLLLHPEVMIHAGLRDVIDETGKVVKSAKAQYSNGALLYLDDIVGKVLGTGTNPLCESVCLTWKSSLTEQVGPFSDQWKYFIDLDYWLRLSKMTAIFYSSEILGSFRVSPGSWTSSIGFKTTREAKEFFMNREEFSSRSTLVRYRAVMQAGLRTIARQLFLSLVLRKKSEERKSK